MFTPGWAYSQNFTVLLLSNAENWSVPGFPTDPPKMGPTARCIIHLYAYTI